MRPSAHASTARQGIVGRTLTYTRGLCRVVLGRDFRIGTKVGLFHTRFQFRLFFFLLQNVSSTIMASKLGQIDLLLSLLFPRWSPHFPPTWPTGMSELSELAYIVSDCREMGQIRDFSDQILVHFGSPEPKCTKIWSEKVPDLSHLNFVPIFRSSCTA